MLVELRFWSKNHKYFVLENGSVLILINDENETYFFLDSKLIFSVNSIVDYGKVTVINDNILITVTLSVIKFVVRISKEIPDIREILKILERDRFYLTCFTILT